MNDAIDNTENEMPNNSATITPRKSYASKIRSERMLAGKQKKPRTIKPTPRQKSAARIMNENITQNLGMTKGEVLLKAGYDISTSEQPQMIENSAGYKQSLAQYGLTEELITSALVEDIEAKPQKRVRELELGADILSMRKRPVETNQTINIAIFSTEQQERIAARIIESLKPQQVSSTEIERP